VEPPAAAAATAGLITSLVTVGQFNVLGEPAIRRAYLSNNRKREKKERNK